ncbi:hypothetical protein STEG23_013017, partial [Scotinomys teguina]
MQMKWDKILSFGMKVLIKKTWSIRVCDTQADDSTSPQEKSFEVSALGQPEDGALTLDMAFRSSNIGHLTSGRLVRKVKEVLEKK